MGRHQRIMRQNPYVNRYGGRTRYMPNRAKDPARKRKREEPIRFFVGPRRGSGRDAQTPQAIARRERRATEATRAQSRYLGALPRLRDVLGAVRARLASPAAPTGAASGGEGEGR